MYFVDVDGHSLSYDVTNAEVPAAVLCSAFDLDFNGNLCMRAEDGSEELFHYRGIFKIPPNTQTDVVWIVQGDRLVNRDMDTRPASDKHMKMSDKNNYDIVVHFSSSGYTTRFRVLDNVIMAADLRNGMSITGDSEFVLRSSDGNITQKANDGAFTDLHKSATWSVILSDQSTVSPYNMQSEKSWADKYLYLRFGTLPTQYRVTESMQKRQKRVVQQRCKSFKLNCRRRYRVQNGLLQYNCMAYGTKLQKTIPRRIDQIAFPWKTCMPHDQMVKICQKAHDEHENCIPRLERNLGRRFQCKFLRRILTQIRDNCAVCNEWKSAPKAVSESIITRRPYQLVMFDVTTMDMPDPDGYMHIMMIKDHFTKFTWAAPLRGKDSSECLGELRKIFQVEGAPERWHCDNGGEFINAAMLELLAEMNWPDLSTGAPKNPRCQGLVERANATLKRKIKVRCQKAGYTIAGSEFPWVRFLDSCIFAENTSIATLYNTTPFLCLRGRYGAEPQCEAMDPVHLKELHEWMTERQQRVAATLTYDSRPEFKIGDEVNVKCRKTNLGKNYNSIGLWTSRAVIFASKPNNTHYRVRWLTPGLCGEKPGQLSKRFIHSCRLKLAKGSMQPPLDVGSDHDFDSSSADESCDSGTASHVLGINVGVPADWFGQEWAKGTHPVDWQNRFYLAVVESFDKRKRQIAIRCSSDGSTFFMNYQTVLRYHTLWVNHLKPAYAVYCILSDGKGVSDLTSNEHATVSVDEPLRHAHQIAVADNEKWTVSLPGDELPVCDVRAITGPIPSKTFFTGYIKRQAVERAANWKKLLLTKAPPLHVHVHFNQLSYRTHVRMIIKYRQLWLRHDKPTLSFYTMDDINKGTDDRIPARNKKKFNRPKPDPVASEVVDSQAPTQVLQATSTNTQPKRKRRKFSSTISSDDDSNDDVSPSEYAHDPKSIGARVQNWQPMSELLSDSDEQPPAAQVATDIADIADHVLDFLLASRRLWKWRDNICHLDSVLACEAAVLWHIRAQCAAAARDFPHLQVKKGSIYEAGLQVMANIGTSGEEKTRDAYWKLFEQAYDGAPHGNFADVLDHWTAWAEKGQWDDESYDNMRDIRFSSSITCASPGCPRNKRPLTKHQIKTQIILCAAWQLQADTRKPVLKEYTSVDDALQRFFHQRTINSSKCTHCGYGASAVQVVHTSVRLPMILRLTSERDVPTLSDTITIGACQYHLVAAAMKTPGHFTAKIQTPNGSWYDYDDRHKPRPLSTVYDGALVPTRSPQDWRMTRRTFCRALYYVRSNLQNAIPYPVGSARPRVYRDRYFAYEGAQAVE